MGGVHLVLTLAYAPRRPGLSIDVFFQPARFDDLGRTSPLSAGEHDAVEKVLRRRCPRGADAHDCWVVEVADGGRAEVFGRNLRNGCMFALSGITPEIVGLLYEVLVAGKWVMLPALEGCGAIVASTDAVHAAPDDFPKVTACTSADALAKLLVDGLVD